MTIDVDTYTKLRSSLQKAQSDLDFQKGRLSTLKAKKEELERELRSLGVEAVSRESLEKEICEHKDMKVKLESELDGLVEEIEKCLAQIQTYLQS